MRVLRWGDPSRSRNAYICQGLQLALSRQSKLGVFLRDNGLMYLANVALDRCPVCSMMTCVATPTLAASVQ